MRRATAAVALVAAFLVPVAIGGSSVAKVHLGIAGDPARFQQQTGQKPHVNHVFLGWGQGQTWGKKLEKFLPLLAPVPMIHLGTGFHGQEAITPLQIANGKGDAYLIHVGEAIADFGSLVYVRPLAEMNHFNHYYAAFTEGGAPRGPQYAPSAYRNAFARIYTLLHGGPMANVNASLRSLGLPPVSRGFASVSTDSLASNSTAALRVIWNPLAGGRPAIPANAPPVFYPGDRYVDVVGNDMYSDGGTWSGEKNENLFDFAKLHRKPYAFPEWGLAGDYPAFVQYICQFIKSHAGIELASYYASIPGIRFDLGNKPKARAEYRRCITPLGKRSP